MYIKGQRTPNDGIVRLIEKMFYNEQAIEAAIREARSQQNSKDNTGGVTGHSFISDPTAAQGIKAAMPLQSVVLRNGEIVYQPEKWLAVIRATYNYCNETERQALRMRYKGESWREICTVLHIEHTTYKVCIRKGRDFAAGAIYSCGLGAP